MIMENRETFGCFYEAEESEVFDLWELFYLVKEKKLIELSVSDRQCLYIRQWKDLPMDYDDWNYNCHMEYWDLYLTDMGHTIYDKWYWRWEDELEEWIESCRRREEVLFPKENNNDLNIWYLGYINVYR